MCWWITSCHMASSLGYFDNFAQCTRGRQGACTGKRCAGDIFQHYLNHRADPNAAFQCLRDLVASGSLTALEGRDIGAANWKSQHCAELALTAIASLAVRHTTSVAKWNMRHLTCNVTTIFGAESRVETNADGNPDHWLMWRTYPNVGSNGTPLTEKVRSLLSATEVVGDSVRYDHKLLDHTEIPDLVLVHNVSEAISNTDLRQAAADLPVDIGRMDLDAIACSTAEAPIARGPDDASHWLEAMALYLGDGNIGHWVVCRRDSTAGSDAWILYDDYHKPRRYTPEDSEAPYPPKSTWHSSFYANMHPTLLLYRRRGHMVDPRLTLPNPAQLRNPAPPRGCAALTNGGSGSKPVTSDDEGSEDDDGYEEQCHSCDTGDGDVELLLCDTKGCTFAFCHSCAGLTDTPPGDWICPACQTTKEATGYFDGGSKGNPGPAGCGAVIFAGSPPAMIDTSSCPRLGEQANFLGRATSQFAELSGALMLCEMARDMQLTRLKICGDSETVIRALNGTATISKPSLKPLADKLLKLVKSMLMGTVITFEHVHRKYNTRADALATEATVRSARAKPQQQRTGPANTAKIVRTRRTTTGPLDTKPLSVEDAADSAGSDEDVNSALTVACPASGCQKLFQDKSNRSANSQCIAHLRKSHRGESTVTNAALEPMAAILCDNCCGVYAMTSLPAHERACRAIPPSEGGGPGIGRPVKGQAARARALEEASNTVDRIAAMAAALEDNVVTLSSAFFFPGRVHAGPFPAELHPLLCDALTPILSHITRTRMQDNTNLWKLLGLFPHLATPAISQRILQRQIGGRQRAIAEHLRSSLLAFMEMTPETLIHRLDEIRAHAAQKAPRSKTRKSSQLEQTVKSAKELVAAGALSRAARTLDIAAKISVNADATAPVTGQPMRITPEVALQLRKLHPEAADPDEDAFDIPGLPEQWEPVPQKIRKTILSFDSKVASGPSGFTINHMKALASSDDNGPDSPIVILTEMLACISAGSIPAALGPVLASCRCLAAYKSDLTPRPLAAGEIMRRVLGRSMIQEMNPEFAKFLGPTQRGVGIAGGPEQVVHLARALLQADEEVCCVSTDIRAAYQEMNRSHILREKRQHFPGIAHYSWVIYGRPSRLYYEPPSSSGDDEFIASQEGSQQGANDGSADFAIGLHPVLQKVRTNHSNVTVSAVHDDVQIIGRPLHVAAALRDFVTYAAEIGLRLNTTKTKVYSMGKTTLTILTVRKAFEGLAKIVASDEGITLMGSPIGADDWVLAELQKTVNENRSRLNALFLLDSAQHANHILLRTCVSRVTHLLRTVPPSLTRAMAEQHDADIWKAFSVLTDTTAPPFDTTIDDDWLNNAISIRDTETIGAKWSDEEVAFIADTAHQQAELPLRAGGFGLSSAVRSAGLAFVSSWALALHKKMADDFPRLGELFQAEAKDRIPLIAELASTWKSVSSLVSVLQCRCDAPKHDTLHCLITMATSAEELEEQDQDKAKDYGAPKKARHFGVGLQGRLWTKAQKKAAVALKNTTAALWSRSDDALHYDAYGRLVEAAGKYGSAWISARPGPEFGPNVLDMNSATFQFNTCMRLGLPPPQKGQPDPGVCRLHARVERVHKLGYHFINAHCNLVGQNIRHNRIRSGYAHGAKMVGDAVHQFRTEPKGLVPGRNSRPADILVESDTVFAMEYDGQRLCVDVTAVTTLGLPLPSNPVQANGTIKHPKPGALAEIKEQGKQTTGDLLLKGTDLKYIPAAVTDLGHQGEGMVKALNHLAGCKYGPVIGANRARDAFLWRCAQLISVGAMRGAAEAYYKIRTLSHNRLKRHSYSSFDHTTTDFDTPSTERTPSQSLRRPSNLPLRVTCVALSELIRLTPASMNSNKSQSRTGLDPPTHSPRISSGDPAVPRTPRH